MALVGHISGSKQYNSVIGVSGSVIVANRPHLTFPALPGSDVKFYVEQLSLFGSEGIVSSGSLAVKNNSGVSKFSVTSTTGNTSVGGTLTSSGVANLNSGLYVAGSTGLSGSLSLGDGLTAAGVSNLNGGLYVVGSSGLSGSLAVGGALTSTGVASLNGGLYAAGSTGLSGSLAVSGASTLSGVANLSSGLYVAGATGLSASLNVGGAAAMASTLDVTGNFAVNTNKFTITAATGAVSGSGLAAFGPTLANGSLTVTATGGTGNGTFAGDVAVNGGDITTTSTSATIFNSGATTVAIGSGATVGLSIGAAAGVVTVAGDLKVTGNDIQSSTATALTLSGADVEVKGDLQITGNDIKSSTGATAITLSEGNVIIPGDLTVNGTTITADVATVTVEDPIMALGFTSGSIAVSAGDRGWVGGILSSNNVAMIWDNSAAEFVVGRTAESGTDADVTLASYSPFHAGNIQGSIISASLGFSGSLTKLMDGTSYLIAGTNITITSASNGAVTISTGAGIGDVVGPASSTGDAVALFDGTTGKLLKNSSITTADGGTSLFVAGKLGVSGSLTSAGVAKLDSGLYVAGAAGLSGSLAVDGVVDLNNSLWVDQSAGVSGSLAVGGGAAINGVVDVNNSLWVDQSAGVSGSLAVAGGVSLSGVVDINNSLWVDQSMGVSGSVYLGASNAETVTFGGYVNSDVLPATDSLYNLGSESNRWANVYTGDLHLRNDRGDYTLIEEEDCLTIRFNKTGKRYKFVLEAVPQFDEDPALKF